MTILDITDTCSEIDNAVVLFLLLQLAAMIVINSVDSFA